MIRQLALLDAALTVQAWRRLPPGYGARVCDRVARDLGCFRVVEGGRGGTCAAAGRNARLQRERTRDYATRVARNSAGRETDPRIAKPAEAAGMRTGEPENLGCIATPRLSDIAGFCKPKLWAALELRPKAAIRPGCAATRGRKMPKMIFLKTTAVRNQTREGAR